MPLHSQTTHDEQRSAESLDAADTSHPAVADQRADPAEEAGTISIELNFNAFADNCPPDRHARRTPNYGDPSVQDFADQALEIAALRAELKRLMHEYDVLDRRARLRDAQVEILRRELASTQAQLRHALRQDPAVSTHKAASAAQDESSPADHVRAAEMHQQHELTATLEIPSAQAGRSGSAPPLMAGAADIPPSTSRPQLIPLDQQSAAIILSRDVITIGRTRGNDICIPSRAVSRDHARLLISRTSVTIVDVDSANGCFVNDRPVKRHALQHGDLLRLGDRFYRFVSASGSR